MGAVEMMYGVSFGCSERLAVYEAIQRTYEFVEVFSQRFTILDERLDVCGHRSAFTFVIFAAMDSCDALRDMTGRTGWRRRSHSVVITRGDGESRGWEVVGVGALRDGQPRSAYGLPATEDSTHLEVSQLPLDPPSPPFL